MEKQRRKKRTHEEVVAAREAYAAEKHQRQLEREKKALERAKLKEEREARKNMTSEEKAADRRKKKVEKLKRGSVTEKNHNPLYDPYKGDIKVGDTVAARFAGCTIFGEILKISDENSNIDSEDEEPQFEFRKGVKNIKLYTILGNDSIKYPVRREQIIAKKGE